MSGMEHVIEAVVKDTNGEISGYKLENGDIVMKDQAVTMAKALEASWALWFQNLKLVKNI